MNLSFAPKARHRIAGTGLTAALVLGLLSGPLAAQTISPPSSGSAGGTNFVGHGLAVPAAAIWTTKISQGGSTLTSNTGGPLTVFYPQASGDQVRYYGVPVPGSTPWTATECFAPAMPGTAVHSTGMAVSDGTKIIIFALLGNNTVPGVYIQRYTNSATYAGTTPLTIAEYNFPGPTLCERINNDGTNFNYSVSGDGVKYAQVFSEGNTAFLTATTVGMFGDANATDAPINVNVWGWEAVTGAGTVQTFN